MTLLLQDCSVNGIASGDFVSGVIGTVSYATTIDNLDVDVIVS